MTSKRLRNFFRLSAGDRRLPLVNQTGDLVITSDASIDNRDELISSSDNHLTRALVVNC